MVLFCRFLQTPSKRSNIFWTSSSSLYLISVLFKLGHRRDCVSWHSRDAISPFPSALLFLEPSGSLQCCRVSFSKQGALFRKHPSISQLSLRSHLSSSKVLTLWNTGNVPDPMCKLAWAEESKHCPVQIMNTSVSMVSNSSYSLQRLKIQMAPENYKLKHNFFIDRTGGRASEKKN